jgi:uncharacterized protein YjbI with pentapeptide repeats
MAEPLTADDANQDEVRRAEALVRLDVLFAVSDGSLGSIEQPSKKGFLEIARKGAAAWNAWRETYPHVMPDFSGTNFRGTPIDFSEFCFSNASLGISCVDFSGAVFGDKNCFRKTHFGDYADFSGAHFFVRADFSQANFGINTDFSEAVFDGTAVFEWTHFGDSVDFQTTEFNGFANYSYCTFLGNCFFTRATFQYNANFKGAAFSGFATFHAAKFCFEMIFVEALFNDTVDFSAVTKDDAPISSRQFQHASFSGATFHNRARFTGRQFLAATDFGVLRGKPAEDGKPPKDKPTVFMGIPDFHGCKFHQDTSFDGAVFDTPLNQEAARAFRTLKLAMEQLKATREEQRFFRLEMKAEHPNLPWGKRWLSTLYSLFSDYGFSLWRPVVWLLSLSLVFGIAYGLLANTCTSNADCTQAAEAAKVASSDERTSAIIKYTLASVAPVPGLDKMQTELRAPLFGHHGWVPIAALTLEILHKIVALLMVFLFALALRNLFKMKS